MSIGSTAVASLVPGRRAGPGRAVLADHADLASGLLALHQATGEQRWLDERVAVLDLVLEHFAGRGPDGEPAGSTTPPMMPSRCSCGRAIPTDGAAPSGAVRHRRCPVDRGLPDRGRRTCALAEPAPGHRGHAVAAGTPIRRLAPGRGRGAGCRAAAGRRVRPAGCGSRRARGRGPSHAPGGSVVVAGEPDEPGRELLAAPPDGRWQPRGLRLPRIRL